jgi:hypothetical protein
MRLRLPIMAQNAGGVRASSRNAATSAAKSRLSSTA